MVTIMRSLFSLRPTLGARMIFHRQHPLYDAAKLG
jgi:hypothetical protein